MIKKKQSLLAFRREVARYRVRTPEGTPQDPLVILLVEDNFAHAELIQRSFEDHPISTIVHHVSDGKMALAYLFRQGVYAEAKKSPRPHIILLDLRLPKIGGLEVLQQIKTSDDLHDIPVIILTTSKAQEDINRAYERHANGYVVKPVDFEQFSGLMEELGSFWLDWNRVQPAAMSDAPP